MASATYREFLAHPSTSLLADRAALHYVTTTTSFLGAADVVKHLTALQKQVKKKRQAVLNLIDGDTVVAFEVETELEFLTSGGVYLPGLDDNFLSDRIAHLPIMHIVTFDRQGKILQIRQQWDQGSLLKQLEIIGKTGRNWPIKDNRDQLSMISNCLEQVGLASPANQGSNNVARARGSSSNALRDPHASLELFAPREQIESAKPSTVVSPYAGNRPRQRDFTEILGDEAHASRERSMSPGKLGQGKNFQPMRIFEGSEHNKDNDDDDGSENQSRKSHIRPDPRKYDHFDFVDGSDPQDYSRPGTTTKERPNSKHDSQWSFDDFVTPQRPKPSKTYRHQDVRNWDVEPGNNEEAGKPAAGKVRRDAEKHFELQDDGELVPRQERPGVKPRGATHNEGLGLYKNNLNREDATPGPKRALGNITNLKDRTKDFDAHFAMVDDSPAAEPSRAPQVPEGRLKAVKMMDANWASYDQSPAAQKENKPRSGQAKDDTKIHIAGDGMGAKKGNNRDWQHGGGPEKEGIHIAGDGMGGKKGTNRNWLFGGDEGATTSAPGAAKAPTARKGNASAAQKSFWDF